MPGRECVSEAEVAECRRHNDRNPSPPWTYGGDGFLMWRGVTYCGSPLKYSTVSMSAVPNTDA